MRRDLALRSATRQRRACVMGAGERRMHMGVFVLGTGNHSAGWRYEGAATSHMQLPVIQEIARIAERGRFDLLFVSDSMVMNPGDHPSFLCRFEPATLITALAMCTTHVGLGATMSTSFNEPFNVARIFGSIDHISNGRAAWNVVTTSNMGAAATWRRRPITASTSTSTTSCATSAPRSSSTS
jgi:alkanesulfonate monooxygenase SsuD/methylene tetrahydromethanopterin reductase-like flavin-dependent oxidoreductase (luciferase family)